MDDTKLNHCKASNYQSIKLALYKQGLTRGHQRLRVFEKLQSAMDRYMALVSSTMGRTTATLSLKDKLHALAINVYPHILLKRGLTAHYEHDGSYNKEEENHSDQALQMPAWSTRSLLATGCDYAYVTEMLTTKSCKEHLIDVTTVNGINYSPEASLRHLLWHHKSQDRTIEFIKDYHPNYHCLLDELKEGHEMEDATTTTTGKKKGYKSTTITTDYDMEITDSSTSRRSDYYSHKVTGTTG